MDPQLLAALLQRSQAAGNTLSANDAGRRERNAVDPALQSRIPGHTTPVGDVLAALQRAQATGGWPGSPAAPQGQTEAHRAIAQGMMGEGRSLGETVDILKDQLESWGIDTSRVGSAIQDVTDPISQGLGALVEGRNPAPAMRGAGGMEVGPSGNFEPADPILAEVLADKGVHPLLAVLADAAFTPDPFGAGRVGDLVPALGLIGAPGLRKLLTGQWKDVDFMPAGLLRDARGNEPRRSPAAQSAFRREVASEGGIQEPALLIYDPSTMRFKLGNGNHRVLAAVEADSPVPVRVREGKVEVNEGMSLPQEGQDALTRLRGTPDGRFASGIRAGQLALPTYDDTTVLNYARTFDEGRLEPFTDADVEKLRGALAENAQISNDLPQSGAILTRPASASPDYTPTIQRAAEDAGFTGTADEWMSSVINTLGPERGIQHIHEMTGLSQQELESTINLWTDTHRGTPEGIPDSFRDPEFNRLADEAQDVQGDFHHQADRGARAPYRISTEVDALNNNLDSLLERYRNMDRPLGRVAQSNIDNALRILEELEGQALPWLDDANFSIREGLTRARESYDELASLGGRSPGADGSFGDIDVNTRGPINQAGQGMSPEELDGMFNGIIDEADAAWRANVGDDPEDIAAALLSDPERFSQLNNVYSKGGHESFWTQMQRAGYTDAEIEAIERAMVGEPNLPRRTRSADDFTFDRADALDAGTRLDANFNELSKEYGSATMEDAIAWLHSEAGREGGITQEDFMNFLMDEAGLDQPYAAELVNHAWGDGLPPDIESAVRNTLGVQATERLADLTTQIEEFQAVLDADVMTDRTVAEGDRLFAEITSMLEDLQPIAQNNEEAREVSRFLEDVRRGIARKIDPLGPNGQ